MKGRKRMRRARRSGHLNSLGPVTATAATARANAAVSRLMQGETRCKATHSICGVAVQCTMGASRHAFCLRTTAPYATASPHGSQLG